MATEKRLIDANPLIERFSGGDELKSMSESLHDGIFVDELRNAPTVDAVPVVRCKDCFADGCCSVQIDLDMGGEGTAPKEKRRNDHGKG